MVTTLFAQLVCKQCDLANIANNVYLGIWATDEKFGSVGCGRHTRVWAPVKSATSTSVYFFSYVQEDTAATAATAATQRDS